MNKSVLFIINGFGMGNATRSDSLMDILATDYRIDVITSDKAYEYFKNNVKVSNLFKQLDLNLEKKIEFGTFEYYVNYIPHFFKRLLTNYKLQKEILALNNYDAVYYDSDYGFILNRLMNNSKNIIGVNNSFEVLSYLISRPSKIKINLLTSLLVETLDFITHYLFCNYVVCPCLGFNFNSERKSKFKKVRLCAPLVRKSLIEKYNLKKTSGVLVMASSSNIQSELSHLKNKPSFAHYTFLVDELKHDNTELFASASLVICNSGQSSITECLYLNKKSLISPLPSHSEQYVNSLIAENLGLHILINVTKDIDAILKTPSTQNYNYKYEVAVKNIKRELNRIHEEICEHLR